ncbi:hypothetical protein ABT093_03605 [Kitasatospora sp. NPDC002551]|uniref:hypothetical protein n=1 Tax=unclassified Kitasatospora TaxID=2633591 RepID=UPI003321897A
MEQRPVNLEKLADELSSSELIRLVENLRSQLSPEVIGSEREAAAHTICNNNYCIVVRPLEK